MTRPTTPAHPVVRRAVDTDRRVDLLPVLITAMIVIAMTLAVRAPSALAHKGGSNDYRSVVTSIEPPDLPIEVEVRDRDDRLRIRNLGDKVLYIYGYDPDPKTRDPRVEPNLYLRIEPGGVWVNRSSGAYVVNQDRYGTTAPAGTDGGGGAANWKRVRRGVPLWEFHDHRIHWMSRTPPPSVNQRDEAAQKVYDWTIPVRYGAKDGTINGRLDYVGGSPRFTVTSVLTVLALLAMVGLFAFDMVRRRQRRRASGVDAVPPPTGASG